MRFSALLLDVTWEYGREAVYELFAVQHEVKHKEIVCMMDEAHLLSRDTLEELRFFLNTDMSSSTPAFLMLSGQSELLSRLRRQEMVMGAFGGRLESSVFHSDAGATYTSFSYREYLESLGAMQKGHML